MPFNRDSNLRKGSESEYFSMDVQPDELALLASKPSVSHPHCLDASQPEESCWDDPDVSKLSGFPEVNLIVDMDGSHGYNDFAVNASEALGGVSVVGIDSSFDGAINCMPEPGGNYLGVASEDCYKRSFIDIVNRLYDLAEWMGIDTLHDRGLLCKATQRFQAAAEKAQENGLRFLMASIQGGSFVGADGNVMFVTNPLHFSTARTMEELGLPILWPGLCQGDEACNVMGPLPAAYEVVKPEKNFPDCPSGQVNEACAKNTLYKSDFLLLEGYGLTLLEDDPDGFKAGWPDPALLAGQYMAFPFDNHAFSHRALAGWLDAFAERIDSAQRLHDRTPCVDARVTSLQHINYDDTPLGGGEYACWNPQYHNAEYGTCPPSESSSGLSDGAVAGIAVGAVVAGAILMFLVMKFVLGYRSGVDKNYGENEPAPGKMDGDSDVDQTSGSVGQASGSIDQTSESA